MPPAPKGTRSKSKGRNQEPEPQVDSSDVVATNDATITTATVVVTTAPIIAVTANISAITTAAVTAVTAAQVAVTLVSSSVATAANNTAVSAAVTSADIIAVTNSDQSRANMPLGVGSTTISSQNITAITAVTSSSSATPIVSAVISCDQSEYNVSGLSLSMLTAWGKCSKEEKDCIEFIRENLEYIRSDKRTEYLTNYLEKGKIKLYVFAILSQMASSISATHSEIMSIRGEEYDPQLPDDNDGSELGAVGGSIPQAIVSASHASGGIESNLVQSADRTAINSEAYQRVLSRLNNSTLEQRLQYCSAALCDSSITLSQYDQLMVIAQHMSLAESELVQNTAASRQRPGDFYRTNPVMRPEPIRAQNQANQGISLGIGRGNIISRDQEPRPGVSNNPTSRQTEPWNQFHESMNELVTTTRANRQKVVTFTDITPFTGNEGSKYALSWWHAFEMDVAVQTNPEEDVLKSFGTLMQKGTFAKNWYEVNGKQCRTLASLGDMFKSEFGPTVEELRDLKDEIRLTKQKNGVSFASFSHELIMMNRELGNAYGETELLTTIYHNMHPRLHKEIKGDQFRTLAELGRLAKAEESFHVRIGVRKLRDDGVQFEHCDTIEQLHALKNKHKPVYNRSNPSQKPAQQQQPAKQSNKPSVQAESKPDSSKAREKKTDQSEEVVAKPKKAFFLDRSKVEKPDDNVTGFTPDQESEWPFYNEKFYCFHCGRKGFLKHYCPYLFTLEQAQENKDKWKASFKKGAKSSQPKDSGNERGGP